MLLLGRVNSKVLFSSRIPVELRFASQVEKTQGHEKEHRQRIVQTDQVFSQDKVKPDSFLGMVDQVVDRQTVSRKKWVEQGISNPAHQRSPTSSKLLEPKMHSNSQELRRVDLHRLGLPLSLKPSRPIESASPDWATPGHRPQDYIQGLSESERTALNTREFQYYSYFQRIRERLERAWVPILREKLLNYYRTGRRMAKDQDHSTEVLVTLNPAGEITRVQLMIESGMSDLDDAAVAAFNRAGPFPNPPKGMVDTNREIKIPWNFVLKS